jgi:DNA-binding transcriptional MerR regulator
VSGANVPLTTPKLAELVGVSGQTLRRWVQLGLLPAPEKVHRGRRGTVSEWPEGSVEQARWVHTQLEAGRTIAKILAALEAGAFGLSQRSS